MTLLLGIDVGTSSVKAVLFDAETSRVVAAAGHEYPIRKPAPDRAEQRPDDWWEGAIAAVRQAVAQAGRRDVDAISLCGQMHGAALLGADGEPLGDAIIWADQRAAADLDAISDVWRVHNFTTIAGTMPAAGFYAVTWRWLARHQREIVARARVFLMPKDFVRYRMTGEIATDVSDAAGTALFDVGARHWSSAIAEEIGIPESVFPPVLESTGRAGSLTPDAAERLGLRTGIAVYAGGADQPAQALANGVIAPGVASVTIGSGGQICTPIALGEQGSLATDPRLHVFNHAVPDMAYLLGATLSAGLSLRWLRRLLGMDSQPDAYARLGAEAAAVAPGADGLIFLPHLTGERTPHMDAAARGAFIGLSAYHERGHLARAVMEGVACSLRAALEISLTLGGRADRVIAAGGAMESDVWRGIAADVLNRPLQKTRVIEQAGVGAALLAGIGARVYRDASEASTLTAQYDSVTEPDTARAARYADLYAVYDGLYPKLRDDFHRLHALTDKD